MTTPMFTYEARSLTGRCANGFERDRGKLVHALYAPAGDWGTALCGARPGRLSGAGFGEPTGSAVTCPKCLARIAKPRAPRLLLATQTVLREIAAGTFAQPWPDVDEAVHKQLNRWDLVTHRHGVPTLTPAGQAALLLLDQR